jgi:hypothetical protein
MAKGQPSTAALDYLLGSLNVVGMAQIFSTRKVPYFLTVLFKLCWRENLSNPPIVAWPVETDGAPGRRGNKVQHGVVSLMYSGDLVKGHGDF